MKRLHLGLTLAAGLAFSGAAGATLIDRGGVPAHRLVAEARRSRGGREMRHGMVKVRMVRFASTIGAVAILASPAPAGATVLDFEEFSLPANLVTNFSSSLSSQGFDFSASSGDILIAGNGQPNVPNTGSNTLVLNAGRPSVVTLSTARGAPFTLNSLLAIEGRNTNTGFFFSSARTTSMSSALLPPAAPSPPRSISTYSRKKTTPSTPSCSRSSAGRRYRRCDSPASVADRTAGRTASTTSR